MLMNAANTINFQFPSNQNNFIMHQFGKRTFFSTNINLSPLSKHKRQSKIQQSKHNDTQQTTHEHKKSVGDSLLDRIKRRTFSLSKLQSVQQSEIAQQISLAKQMQLPFKRSITDKVVFEKLQIDTNQNNRQFPRTTRQRSQRNPFFQTDGEEEISLLKMILRKKEEDIIHARQKQLQKEKQAKLQILQNKPEDQTSSAIKRIKMLKKSQEYEYYDNIVHKLLNNAQKIEQINIDHDVQQNQPSEIHKQNQSMGSRNFKKQLRSTSLSNIKAVVEKGKQHFSTNSNFYSTQTLTNFSGLAQKKPDKMIFGMSNVTSDTIYEKKITTLIEFLYKVNYSNSIYVDLSLSGNINRCAKKTYKVFVGPGNNSELIRSIIKRRFWLDLATTKTQANFIWTQDTQKQVHSRQLQQEKQPGISNTDEQINRKPTFSFKHKFTKPSYTQKSNSKILNTKEIEEADVSYSRSYMGLKSIHSQISIKILTNHIPNNSIIGSKKILFKLMHWYYSQIQKKDPFIFLPHTYHMIPGDKENIGIKKFKEEQLTKKQKIWIVKPGQNTNRGNGIQVTSTCEIQRLMRYKKFHKNGEPKTYIVQKYLKPFLYNNRKFDIRHYLLITSINGLIKGYWYNSGYIRTSSQKFDLEDIENEFIHLTNDAIQKNSQNYGKYEQGNKLSYSTFQRYLDNTFPHKKYDFEAQILNEMKKITTDVLKAGFMFLDPDRNQRLSKGNAANFQLYGMDFMIDHKFRPYLIQINANPCLEISCPLLERLIPIVIEHTFRLSIDPLMPPFDHYAPSKRYQLCDRILDRLKFELIFDEKHEGKQLRQKHKNTQNKFQLNGVPLEPEEDLFEDDGKEISDENLFDEAKE